MPDPQVLYIVTVVVALGLVLWVVTVLVRAEPVPAMAAAPLRSVAPPEPKAAEPEVRSVEVEEEALDLDIRTAVEPSTKVIVADEEPERPETQPERPKTQPERPKTPRPWLHSYAEIQDEPPSSRLDETDETGPNALILVTAVGRSDPGLKRKHNEDAYAILEDHHLFVIADGMGRHAAGEIASAVCVEAITDAFVHSTFGPPRDPPLPKRAARLRGAILLANERVFATASEHEAYQGMGTTVVAAYFSANNQRIYIAHVGDSRCYRLRHGELTQLTTDHTLGAAGIQGKTAQILSRAVGVEADVEVDTRTEAALPGDIYLLCSDGLSRMVAAEEIQSTLVAAGDLDEATRLLIDLANRSGGRDNITIILVRVDDARLSAS
jgi:protein phosphatase